MKPLNAILKLESQLLKAKFRLITAEDVAKTAKKYYSNYNPAKRKSNTQFNCIYVRCLTFHLVNAINDYTHEDIMAHLSLNHRSGVRYYKLKHDKLILENHTYKHRYLNFILDLVKLENKLQEN